MNLETSIKELNRMFTYFNKVYYDSALETPIIIIQTNGKHKNVLGWCTSRKIWSDKDQNQYYEISLSAEYLKRDIKQIIGTLLHEMVHLHNLQYDIKDVSRGGTYHNKTFKKVAEEKGLIIEFDKKIGWSLTSINTLTLDHITKLKPNESAFSLARMALDEGSSPKKKSSSRKYICPVCDTQVRATKEVNIYCGDCEEKMIAEETEED